MICVVVALWLSVEIGWPFALGLPSRPAWLSR